MEKGRKFRKVLLWLMLATLAAGLVWAIGAELAQTNKNVQTAAALGADDELATIETAGMVKPKDNKIDWSTINRYERQLKQNTAEYQKLVTQAGNEKAAGAVSAATRSAGTASAQKFSQISEELAAVYEKGNCITKAKTVRAASQSRLKNAEMAFNDLDSGLINDYSDQRSAMSEAGLAGLKEDKANGSPADIARLKTAMLPRLQKMSSETTQLLGEVTKLLDQVRQAAGGGVGGLGGCARQAVTSGAADGPAGLLRPLTSLMNMLKNMGSNIASTMQAVTAL